MKLLVVTDHCFLQYASNIFDTFCFDQNFFVDYHQIFEDINVVSRVNKVSSLPPGAFRSDNHNVQFINVPAVHGLSWFIKVNQFSQTILKPAINDVDAVVVRIPSQLGWFATKYARCVGKPYMVEVIGDPQEAWRQANNALHYKLIASLETYRLRHMLHYALNASYVSSYLQHAYPLPKGRSSDIISSIRLGASEITPQRTFSATSDPFRIVHVGTLTPRKRCGDLIKACRNVLDRGVPIELHLAGDGPDREKLHALASNLHLSKQVVFHGHIAEKKNLKNLLDVSHLFIMTSASEGLPRAMLEAMARGLPVVGTNIPGINELARDTELFAVGNIDALANLIIEIAEDPARLTQMSQYSIKVANRYSTKVLSPKRQYLYQELRDSVSNLQLA